MTLKEARNFAALNHELTSTLVRNVAHSTQRIVDFQGGYIVLDVMKRTRYAPGGNEPNPQKFQEAQDFEKGCAHISTALVFDPYVGIGIPPVDMIVSIGTTGIEYGDTVLATYQQLMQVHGLPNNVAYFPIRKVGDALLTDDIKDHSQIVQVPSFTNNKTMEFAIPDLSQIDVPHLPNKRPIRTLVVDDVFAKGNTFKGTMDAFLTQNPQVELVAAFAMMSKLFQDGEKRIQKEFGIPTHAPVRFKDGDLSTQTFNLVDPTRAFDLRLQ